MTKPPVLTKADFVRRYQQGEFGNRALTWDSLEVFLQYLKNHMVDKSRRYHLRNRVAAGKTYYNIRADEVQKLWEACEDKDQWYLSEMAPHRHNIMQGEVTRSVEGMDLTYSTLPNLPMREALNMRSHRATKLTAVMLINAALNDKSLEWLRYLLDEYPDHIIEFSAFDVCWGVLPGYNTVFWEVRKY